MSRTTISRDPFARTELVRSVVPKGQRKPCAWCEREGRFVYGTCHDDSGRVHTDAKVYCSVSCMRSYTN